MIEILLVGMKTEVIFNQHILDQIGISQINSWIQEFEVSSVWDIRILAVVDNKLEKKKFIKKFFVIKI